jgi:hypothetical protein
VIPVELKAGLSVRAPLLTLISAIRPKRAGSGRAALVPRARDLTEPKSSASRRREGV